MMMIGINKFSLSKLYSKIGLKKGFGMSKNCWSKKQDAFFKFYMITFFSVKKAAAVIKQDKSNKKHDAWRKKKIVCKMKNFFSSVINESWIQKCFNARIYAHTI